MTVSKIKTFDRLAMSFLMVLAFAPMFVVAASSIH